MVYVLPCIRNIISISFITSSNKFIKLINAGEIPVNEIWTGKSIVLIFTLPFLSVVWYKINKKLFLHYVDSD